jgi:hypothetical protein
MLWDNGIKNWQCNYDPNDIIYYTKDFKITTKFDLPALQNLRQVQGAADEEFVVIDKTGTDIRLWSDTLDEPLSATRSRQVAVCAHKTRLFTPQKKTLFDINVYMLSTHGVLKCLHAKQFAHKVEGVKYEVKRWPKLKLQWQLRLGEQGKENKRPVSALTPYQNQSPAKKQQISVRTIRALTF